MKGNSEKLDEIARTFNESLSILEEKKKESMKIKKSNTQKSMSNLPPINDTNSMIANKKQPFYSSRPVSAITTRSIDTMNASYFIKSLLEIEKDSHKMIEVENSLFQVQVKLVLLINQHFLIVFF